MVSWQAPWYHHSYLERWEACACSCRALLKKRHPAANHRVSGAAPAPQGRVGGVDRQIPLVLSLPFSKPHSSVVLPALRHSREVFPLLLEMLWGYCRDLGVEVRLWRFASWLQHMLLLEPWGRLQSGLTLSGLVKDASDDKRTEAAGPLSKEDSTADGGSLNHRRGLTSAKVCSLRKPCSLDLVT